MKPNVENMHIIHIHTSQKQSIPCPSFGRHCTAFKAKLNKPASPTPSKSAPFMPNYKAAPAPRPKKSLHQQNARQTFPSPQCSVPVPTAPSRPTSEIFVPSVPPSVYEAHKHRLFCPHHLSVPCAAPHRFPLVDTPSRGMERGSGVELLDFCGVDHGMQQPDGGLLASFDRCQGERLHRCDNATRSFDGRSCQTN